ncbi:hypothetical protein N7495_009949 [Penicillium taxi]|uniref:uncharacterized protein n=1 Tax=Penicillium taxi TaxID=168475 RepID=UPI00254570B3|nr:uncharacterized protein N7495_009949 [Penicillium taxi]KAJ5885439.1 hypothetical protein N7495_009949 [Penicillium taxi]
MAKRTLDAFFKPQARKRQQRSLEDSESDSKSSKHPTYPHAIKHLPLHINSNLNSTPAQPARTINNQPRLDLLYFQPFLRRDTAADLFKFLRAELPFYRVQYSIKRGGVDTLVNTPRFTTIFGVDETARFVGKSKLKPDSLSGDGEGEASEEEELILVDATSQKPLHSRYQYPPRPIPPCLDTLRQHVQAATGATYNFVLVNYYASGEDSIAFHSDDERFLGADPDIASVSLGGERDFILKMKPVVVQQGTADEIRGCTAGSLSVPRVQTQVKMPLASGDMIVMRGSTQAAWLHSIPKRKGRSGDSVRGRVNITFRRAMVPAGTNNYYNYNVGCGEVWRWDDRGMEMRIRSTADAVI